MLTKIFLIGLPGSGKTTLGKQLAAQMRVPFVDLDKVIEQSTGMPVEEIFKASGEAGFRQLETDELNAWCERTDSFVMATGGGAPCFNDNLILMKRIGKVIFLDVPPKTISERIILEVAHRPLLKHETADSLKDRIEFLRSQRISFYKQAHQTISGSAITTQNIMDSLA